MYARRTEEEFGLLIAPSVPHFVIMYCKYSATNMLANTRALCDCKYQTRRRCLLNIEYVTFFKRLEDFFLLPFHQLPVMFSFVEFGTSDEIERIPCQVSSNFHVTFVHVRNGM